MAKTPELDLRDNSFKNYIINGDMKISQRGTSFVAIASGIYSLDRYSYNKAGTVAVHTASQDTDAPTFVQAGYLFQNSLRLNLTTPDTSIAAGDVLFIDQRVEGYNWTNLAQRAFTLSFWVKATLPGIYCAAFTNSGANRSYVAEYTINVSDTWEYKTITVSASPSAGTWDYTNGIGLRVRWCLAAGSTFQTTANAWNTGDFVATSNQVNGVNTGATDFKITGVMLNAGTEAAGFRLFSSGNFTDEFSSCQRYLERGRMFQQVGASLSNQTTWVNYATAKRAAGTMTQYQAGTFNSATFNSFQSTSTNGVAITVDYSVGSANALVFWQSEIEL